MKRKIFLSIAMILAILGVLGGKVFSTGQGNIDGSGGGKLGKGTGESYWKLGDDGVRVTVINAQTRKPVSTPIDLSNRHHHVDVHFGKMCKLDYLEGRNLSIDSGQDGCLIPGQPLPQIIGTNGGNSNVSEIKKYFTDKQVAMSIAPHIGMDFSTLVNGKYKFMIEPIGYFRFNGTHFAMTATQAALYDEQVGGNLRRAMGKLTHQNLPLSIFLETSDLGLNVWTGSRNSMATNANIKSALGIGIVRFAGVKPEPPINSPAEGSYDYTYRVNTDVITAVNITGGQSDPKNSVSVNFNIGGRIYTVNNVYYPEGDGQLAWVKWRTPSRPQKMTISVNVSGQGRPDKREIRVNIVDISANPPPNPTANDRNSSYRFATIPNNLQKTCASWSVWNPYWQPHWVWIHNWQKCGKKKFVDRGHWEDKGCWAFKCSRYSASLSAQMKVTPDVNCPTAKGGVIKSGYGINETVTANISASQMDAVTMPQTTVSYFPEFEYKNYCRVLDMTSSGYSSVFQLPKNQYSTLSGRAHFLPIWFPDGPYQVYTEVMDDWTPAGMLSINLSSSVMVKGNLWSDWHTAPTKNPKEVP